MKLLDKILKGSASELVENMGNAIDGIVTNDEEKQKAKNQLTQIATDKLTEVAGFQKEVLLAELNGTKLQRSWRPIVMLSFAAIVVYSKFIAPAFSLPNTELEPDFWGLLELGLGGYVIGRSLEKITHKLTENADMTFLRKKHRNTN